MGRNGFPGKVGEEGIKVKCYFCVNDDEMCECEHITIYKCLSTGRAWYHRNGGTNGRKSKKPNGFGLITKKVSYHPFIMVLLGFRD